MATLCRSDLLRSSHANDNMAQRWKCTNLKVVINVTNVLFLLCVNVKTAKSNVPTYYLHDYCSNTLDMGTAKVKAGLLMLRRPQEDLKSLDCNVLIKAPANKLLTFKFQHFDIKSLQGCSPSYIQIFEGSGRQLPLTEKLCNTNKMTDRAYVTSGEEALLHLTLDQVDGDQMELVFTSFSFSPCIGGDYQCHNAHCIAKELYCNGMDNCGDGSDICILKTEALVAIIATACTIVFIVAVIVMVCLVRRQRKIRRERVSG